MMAASDDDDDGIIPRHHQLEAMRNIFVFTPFENGSILECQWDENVNCSRGFSGVQ
jgi:hypothetical protein